MPCPERKAFNSGFFSEQRHDNIPLLGGRLPAYNDHITVENPGIDHGIPLYMQGEMLAGAV